jgi:heat shock protein HtpX
MASLYSHRSANVRKTWALFALFFAVVIGAGYAVSRVYGDPSILYLAVGVSVLMNVAAYWWSDKLVLKMTKARPVTRESARELYQTVENLSIAAGLPLPKIYLIDEASPNAFATGRNPEHAVVAVTTGLLSRLNGAELEGVLAHELSHIGNRDMLLSTAVIVLVGFISIVSDIFTRSMFWGGMRRRSDEHGNAGAVLVVAGLALAILAPIVATLMRLAISRKREFLADASGALLTRYPEGLASALEKIAHDATPLKAATNTTAHLWFDDPFDKPGQKVSWITKLFMTHPPVGERVRALRGQNL